jgi:ATP-dependent Clp protease adapter protein ClpS
MTQGLSGFARWTACVAVIFAIFAMLLQRAGIAIERPRLAGATRPADEIQSVREGRGRLRIATVHGVPVFIHWSFPLGGLVLAFIAGARLFESICYCLAFAVLIAVHELGHFAAARAFGLKVHAIDISGWGGMCVVQIPRSVRHTFVVYAGGLMAQLALLAATLATFCVIDIPRAPPGRSVFITFTFVNVLLGVINLIPSKTYHGLSNDGEVLWDLFLHVFKGRPHPLAKHHAASPVFAPETHLLTLEGFAPPGFTTGVELLNDDTTPMEFVIDMLTTCLKLDRESAIQLMLRIHTQGGVLVSLPDLQSAEEIAGAITREARDKGHQLICRAVDADAS